MRLDDLQKENIEMSVFFGKSIMHKVVLFFLVLAAMQSAAVGYLAYRSSRAAVETAVLGELENANKQRARQVSRFMQEAVDDLSLLVKNPLVGVAFELFSFYAAGGDTAKHEKSIEVDSQEYNQVVSEIDPLFRLWLELFEEKKGYHDLLMIVGKGKGLIVYTQRRLADRGESLSKGGLRESALAKLWQKVSETHKPAVVDFSYYKPAGGATMFAGYPIFAEEKFCGMLAVRIGTEFFDAVMTETGALGKSGEAFIVGDDFLMRSKSRLGGDTILKRKVETQDVKQALQGKSGTGLQRDYRGIPVLASWTPLTMGGKEAVGNGFKWAIIGKKDSGEALEAVTSLGYFVVVVAVLVGIVVAVVAFWLARSLAKPITQLAGKADQISSGDLTVEIPNRERADEIGMLACSFDQMLQSLRNQTRNMLDTVSVLTASATDISSTATQLAHSTSKTNTAISETTSTVEEVKQAATLASEKAKNVEETSHKAVAVSESGMTATQGTIEKMRLIKEQMDSVAETVVKLNEQSQAIENIVLSVQDLADQSNLLAVNASIEAARAGDQGKGFAVVAHEIKSLADQSREATEQIRNILEEIRRWVSAVVVATEQGSKAVNSGFEQSTLAGESIGKLTESVTASAQAATVINASSEQQLSGVDQVAGAMGNIEQAIRQNLDGSSQLEASARKLEALGGKLRALVQQYRV